MCLKRAGSGAFQYDGLVSLQQKKAVFVCGEAAVGEQYAVLPAWQRDPLGTALEIGCDKQRLMFILAEKGQDVFLFSQIRDGFSVNKRLPVLLMLAQGDQLPVIGIDGIRIAHLGGGVDGDVVRVYGKPRRSCGKACVWHRHLKGPHRGRSGIRALY